MRVSREERQGSADASVACATESRRIRRMDVDRRTGFHARNARDAPMLLSHALPNHGDSGGWTWTDGPGFTRGTPGMRRCFCRMRYRITADPEDGRGQTDRVSREGRQGCADASVACATESRRLLRAERVPVCFKRTHREGSAMIPHRKSRNHACAWPTGQRSSVQLRTVMATEQLYCRRNRLRWTSQTMRGQGICFDTLKVRST